CTRRDKDSPETKREEEVAGHGSGLPEPTNDDKITPAYVPQQIVTIPTLPSSPYRRFPVLRQPQTTPAYGVLMNGEKNIRWFVTTNIF
ncbi:hypothetical protein M8C21_029192, partial [Ambrosia artemisiifolia]